MTTLALFPSVFFILGEPSKNFWSEKTSSKARNFCKGYLLYLKFSELEELCLYFTVMYNFTFYISIFFKNIRQKRHFLNFFESRKMNLSAFEETYVGLIKNVVLELFSKYYQTYINLKFKCS